MGKREDYEAKTEKLIMPIVEANNVELFDVAQLFWSPIEIL